jgi:hypothetical protein
MQKDKECPVCLEMFTKDHLAIPFVCGHGLCQYCNKELEFRSDYRCPICRKPRIGVSSAQNYTAAQSTNDNIFFPIQSDFELTSELLFGRNASQVLSHNESQQQLLSMQFVNHAPNLRSLEEFIQQEQHQRQIENLQSVEQSLLVAQNAAVTLCNPEIDDDTFNAIIHSVVHDS